MAETRYGFTDTGDIILTQPNNGNCDSSCCGDAMSKINEITKNAPVDGDTFAEVADKINSIIKRINEIEAGNVDMTGYAKKSDLCRYITRHEASNFVTSAEMEAELLKLNPNDYVTRKEFEDTFKTITGEDLNLSVYETKAHAEATYAKKEEIPSLDNVVTEDKLEESLQDKVDNSVLDDYAKTVDVETKITEAVDAIEIPSIEGLATEQYVTEAIEAIEIPSIEGLVDEETLNESLDGIQTSITAINTSVDEVKESLKDYATKAELDALEIPEAYDDTEINNRISALEEIDHTVYATKEEVKTLSDKVDAIEIPSLNGYVTEDNLDSAVSSLKDEVSVELNKKADIDDVYSKEDADNKFQEAGDYVAYTDISNESNPERKALILGNHDALQGRKSDGNPYNLIMMSKWDVVDFGSMNANLNINTKGDIKINNDKTIATKEWVEEKVGSIEIPTVKGYDDTEIKNRLDVLEKKEDKDTVYDDTDIKSRLTNLEQKEDYDDTELKNRISTLEAIDHSQYLTEHQSLENYALKSEIPSIEGLVSETFVNEELAKKQDELDNFKAFVKAVFGNNIDTVTTADNKNKDGNLFVTGSYVGDKVTRTTYTANNGNVNCYDMDIKDSSLEIIAKNGDVTVSELTTSGSCYTDSKKLRNLSVDASDNIIIKDWALDAECYNGVQINMDKALSDNVTIENVDVAGTIHNNGIIVFGTKDNAAINIKNININEAKNAFRFSNRSNAQGVVVNMENIKVDNVREKFFLFEDMKKEDNKSRTDLFKNMVFNLKNVTLNGESLTADTLKKDIIQMVVGRPSQSEDVQVELTEEVLPTFNFE